MDTPASGALSILFFSPQREKRSVMKQKTLFLEKFADYAPEEAVAHAFHEAVISAADINVAARIMEVCVESPRYIPQRLIRINFIGREKLRV